MRSSRTQYYSGISSFSRPLNPADIAGEPELWLDGSERASIINSGTSMTSVSNFGSKFPVMTFIPSGTVTTGVSTSSNGLNLLGASGAASVVNAGFAYSTPTNNRTRIHVCSPTVNQESTSVNFYFTGGTASSRELLYMNAANGGRPSSIAVGPINRMITQDVLPNQTNVLALYTFRNGATAANNRIAYNGSNMVLSTSAVGSWSATSAIVTFANNQNLGEFVHFLNDLNSTSTSQLEGYAAWKWGLVSQLDNAHTFKLAPPLAPLFIPTAISGCTQWLDAADTTRFTGGATWTDKSGTGNNLTREPNSTAMPTVTTWPNGLRAARFVAASKNGAISTNTNYMGPNMMLFTVLRITAQLANNLIFFPDLSEGKTLYVATTTLGWRPINVNTNTSATVAVNQIFLVAQYFTSTESRFFLNGSQVATGSATTTGWTARKRLFGTNNTIWASCDIAEFIAYTGVSWGGMRQIEGYLAWKWGLQTSLPANHPFRKVKP